MSMREREDGCYNIPSDPYASTPYHGRTKQPPVSKVVNGKSCSQGWHYDHTHLFKHLQYMPSSAIVDVHSQPVLKGFLLTELHLNEQERGWLVKRA